MFEATSSVAVSDLSLGRSALSNPFTQRTFHPTSRCSSSACTQRTWVGSAQCQRYRQVNDMLNTATLTGAHIGFEAQSRLSVKSRSTIQGSFAENGYWVLEGFGFREGSNGWSDRFHDLPSL